MFEQCGYGREAIQARLERNWTEMFEGPDKIYWENDEGLGYVMDTGNHDVRTEGMSYAMMIAVQYDRKDVFDKLWGWVMKYMFMTEGLHKGYFAWSVDLSGVPNADGPAPRRRGVLRDGAVPGLRALGRWRGRVRVLPPRPLDPAYLRAPGRGWRGLPDVESGEPSDQVHPGNRMDRPVLPFAALL